MIGRAILPGSWLIFAPAQLSNAQATLGIDKSYLTPNSCISILLTLMTSDSG